MYDPFDPSQTIARITTSLLALDQKIADVQADRRLSPEGKSAKIDQMTDVVYRDVQGDAGLMLKSLQRQVEKTQAALIDAERAFDAGVDPVRSSLALKTAEIAATTSDWQAIRPQIDKAIQHQDIPSLRAWATLADSLRQRFGRDERYRLDVLKTSEQVKSTLDAATPDSVLKARQAALDAQERMYVASERVDRFDFERSLQGRPPVFRDVLRPDASMFSTVGGPGSAQGWVIEGSRVW